MAKNVDTAVLDRAVAARIGGLAAKECLKQFGLSHTQFEFHFLYNATLEQGGMQEVARSVQCDGATVVALRHEGATVLKGTAHDGPLSWGKIAVLCGCTEAKVRRTYERHSKVLSEGQRIGKGGRFYERDEAYYQASLRKPGTAIPANLKKDKAAKLEQAEVQRLIADYRLAGGTAKNPTVTVAKAFLAKAKAAPKGKAKK